MHTEHMHHTLQQNYQLPEEREALRQNGQLVSKAIQKEIHEFYESILKMTSARTTKA